MEVTVKVRFNASKERIESFGSNRYMMYLEFPEDKDAQRVITSILSRYMGVPEHLIEFKCKAPITKDWVFNVN
jgi:hypothetical protein